MLSAKVSKCKISTKRVDSVIFLKGRRAEVLAFLVPKKKKGMIFRRLLQVDRKSGEWYCNKVIMNGKNLVDKGEQMFYPKENRNICS